MDLATMQTRVLADLNDASNARYSVATVQRAIQRAVDRLSEVHPLVGHVDVAMGSSRWFDLSGQTNYLWCEAVEYPIDDAAGVIYLRFREDRNAKKVYVLGQAPTLGQNVRFWYGQAHTINGGTTVPQEYWDLIALGAAALAVQMQAAYAIDRLSPSAEAPKDYLAWAEKMLGEFEAKLAVIKEERLQLVDPTVGRVALGVGGG